MEASTEMAEFFNKLAKGIQSHGLPAIKQQIGLLDLVSKEKDIVALVHYAAVLAASAYDISAKEVFQRNNTRARFSKIITYVLLSQHTILSHRDIGILFMVTRQTISQAIQDYNNSKDVFESSADQILQQNYEQASATFTAFKDTLTPLDNAN